MRNHVLLAVTVSLAALLAGCGRQEVRVRAASAPPPVPVAVEPVTAQPFHATVRITGTLVSNARVEVKAEVVGRITRFDKEEGARVAAGESLAWVNDENYQLALRQAETGVRVAEAGVERASLLEAHSRAEQERAENLKRSGGITDKDLKAAQLAERDARAQSAVAGAQLQQARAALEVARKHLRDTVIQAPISGEIQKKFVNRGAYVEAPTPVAAIVDNRKLELEAPVAAADIAPVTPGQRVTFTVSGYPGLEFEGTVIEIGPALDEQTRSAKVRVRVSNPGGKLKAGMFAQGEILTAVNGSALVVPAGAVYRDERAAGASYVFVVENGKAARRNVQTGRERDGKLEIANGLKPGDRLIAEQSLQIAEGVRVEARR